MQILTNSNTSRLSLLFSDSPLFTNVTRLETASAAAVVLSLLPQRSCTICSIIRHWQSFATWPTHRLCHSAIFQSPAAVAVSPTSSVFDAMKERLEMWDRGGSWERLPGRGCCRPSVSSTNYRTATASLRKPLARRRWVDSTVLYCQGIVLFRQRGGGYLSHVTGSRKATCRKMDWPLPDWWSILQ